MYRSITSWLSSSKITVHTDGGTSEHGEIIRVRFSHLATNTKKRMSNFPYLGNIYFNFTHFHVQETLEQSNMSYIEE